MGARRTAAGLAGVGRGSQARPGAGGGVGASDRSVRRVRVDEGGIGFGRCWVCAVSLALAKEPLPDRRARHSGKNFYFFSFFS